MNQLNLSDHLINPLIFAKKIKTTIPLSQKDYKNLRGLRKKETKRSNILGIKESPLEITTIPN